MDWSALWLFLIDWFWLMIVGLSVCYVCLGLVDLF